MGINDCSDIALVSFASCYSFLDLVLVIVICHVILSLLFLALVVGLPECCIIPVQLQTQIHSLDDETCVLEPLIRLLCRYTSTRIQ